RALLRSVHSVALSMEIVEETERQLLEEVVDWYFDLEKGEHFYSLFRTQRTATGLRLSPENSRSHANRWVGAAFTNFGLATVFALQVLVRRSLWILASAAAVVLWLWSHEGTSTAVRSELRELGVFVDQSNNPWTSDPERAEHGCVVIVHGLWGPPKLT